MREEELDSRNRGDENGSGHIVRGDDGEADSVPSAQGKNNETHGGFCSCRGVGALQIILLVLSVCFLCTMLLCVCVLFVYDVPALFACMEYRLFFQLLLVFSLCLR